MKMTPEHYAVLKSRVARFLPDVPAHRVRSATEPKIKDVEARVLWDVYHAAQMYQLYSYQEWDYKDAHIETAMRAIFKEAGV